MKGRSYGPVDSTAGGAGLKRSGAARLPAARRRFIGRWRGHTQTADARAPPAMIAPTARPAPPSSLAIFPHRRRETPSKLPP